MGEVLKQLAGKQRRIFSRQVWQYCQIAAGNREFGRLIGDDLVYNEWSVPNHFREQIGMTAEAKNPMLAGIHFYHEDDSRDFQERGVRLLDLLLPSFKAGVYTWLSLAERCSAYLTTFGALGDGVLLLSPRGDIIGESSSLAAALAREPECARVLQAMRSTGTALGAWMDRKPDSAPCAISHEPLVRELRTRSASYRILATRVPEGIVAPAAAVAVALTRQSTRAVSPERLRELYGLTAREMEVATLIASGLRNEEIARAIDVSVRTALRHTERVLRKLGVHSRAAVAAALLQVG